MSEMAACPPGASRVWYPFSSSQMRGARERKPSGMRASVWISRVFQSLFMTGGNFTTEAERHAAVNQDLHRREDARYAEGAEKGEKETMSSCRVRACNFPRPCAS